MKINVIGQIFGTSGYASHTKQLARALYDIADVKLSSQIPGGFEKELSDEELLMLKKPDGKDRINIIIGFPHSWSQFCDRENNVGFLIWEGDRIPKDWMDCCANLMIKQVWVPSVHTKDAILETLKDYPNTSAVVVPKIRIVPHGVNLDLFYPVEKPGMPITFVCNKGFRNVEDRGGIQYAIQAFLNEFPEGQGKLLIKLNSAYSIDLGGFNAIMSQLGVKSRSDVILNTQNIDYKSMNLLYAQGHILLNPVRAEAFSIPCAEAMACGLPVITTNYGGQTDFVTNENGWLVDYDLEEVKHEIMYEGVRWATPQLASLQKAMREAADNYELRKKKSEQAIKDIQEWTWKKSAEKAVNFLNEIIA